jgi:hypothetical protein
VKRWKVILSMNFPRSRNTGISINSLFRHYQDAQGQAPEIGPGLPFRGRMAGAPVAAVLESLIASPKRSSQELAAGRSSTDRTLAVIAILEEKRAEVMAKDQAGYFIHEWQELRDQVRTMIAHDSRYKAIQARRAAAGSRGGF